MLVRVRQDHTFDLRATGREGLWNDDRDRFQGGLVFGQPSSVEVSKSRPAEHVRAPFEKGAKRLRDRAQIGASPAVKKVALEVVDRGGLKRALELLMDHCAIGLHAAAQRLRKHDP